MIHILWVVSRMSERKGNTYCDERSGGVMTSGQESLCTKFEVNIASTKERKRHTYLTQSA